MLNKISKRAEKLNTSSDASFNSSIHRMTSECRLAAANNKLKPDISEDTKVFVEQALEKSSRKIFRILDTNHEQKIKWYD